MRDLLENTKVLVAFLVGFFLGMSFGAVMIFSMVGGFRTGLGDVEEQSIQRSRIPYRDRPNTEFLLRATLAAPLLAGLVLLEKVVT
jgi:hypothetical protein